MSLRDLPVPVDEYGDISQVYVKERNAVGSPEELVKFVERWVELFKLDIPEVDKENETYKEYMSLVEGTFNPVSALECLKILREKRECGHESKYSCCGMHIMLPYILMAAFLASRQYGVPLNVALIQLTGGYEF